jgi:hypothetical protein
MRKKQIAAIVLALWLAIISVVMLFMERIDMIEFFILGLIGFLVIIELTEPTYVTPGYFHYVRFLIAAGLLIFGVIVVQVMMDTLGLVIII